MGKTVRCPVRSRSPRVPETRKERRNIKRMLRQGVAELFEEVEE